MSRMKLMRKAGLNPCIYRMQEGLVLRRLPSSFRKRYNPSDMWSVRMRASGKGGVHISGAEGIYRGDEVQQAMREYSLRAMGHPRGIPKEVVLTVERLTRKPRSISTLPLRTLECRSPLEADGLIHAILSTLKVSKRATDAALKMLRKDKAMRGAALMDSFEGIRHEPDRKRGVRVSRMGIEKKALRVLSRRLGRRGINTPVVKEALVLASKVASAEGVLAELCISDDPDYTTGYIASRKTGYLRIPNIKRAGSRRGGRVFFIDHASDVEKIIAYLEREPVMITRVSEVKGSHRFLSAHNYCGDRCRA